ncbi:uncharacterized protein V1516DRAFT_676807 [Lipomyces oligophaga]|uniref:uncharacterized protein n=1 Tax=Lipomyces oligophaga TaxID=45792 RepID=UPI0034CE5E1F
MSASPPSVSARLRLIQGTITNEIGDESGQGLKLATDVDRRPQGTRLQRGATGPAPGLDTVPRARLGMRNSFLSSSPPESISSRTINGVDDGTRFVPSSSSPSSSLRSQASTSVLRSGSGTENGTISNRLSNISSPLRRSRSSFFKPTMSEQTYPSTASFSNARLRRSGSTKFRGPSSGQGELAERTSSEYFTDDDERPIRLTTAKRQLRNSLPADTVKRYERIFGPVATSSSDANVLFENLPTSPSRNMSNETVVQRDAVWQAIDDLRSRVSKLELSNEKSDIVPQYNIQGTGHDLLRTVMEQVQDNIPADIHSAIDTAAEAINFLASVLPTDDQLFQLKIDSLFNTLTDLFICSSQHKQDTSQLADRTYQAHSTVFPTAASVTTASVIHSDPIGSSSLKNQTNSIADRLPSRAASRMLSSLEIRQLPLELRAISRMAVRNNLPPSSPSSPVAVSDPLGYDIEHDRDDNRDSYSGLGKNHKRMIISNKLSNQIIRHGNGNNDSDDDVTDDNDIQSESTMSSPTVTKK